MNKEKKKHLSHSYFFQGNIQITAAEEGTSIPMPFYFSRLIYLVVFGATVGAILDYLHTDGGEITYPEGTNHWRGVLTFALAYSIGPVLYLTFCRVAGLKDHPVPYWRSGLSTCVYIAMYVLTAYSPFESITTASILLGTSLAMWYLHDSSWQGLLAACVTGFIGAGIESSLIYFGGTMTYTTQELFNVPYWLPMIYFCSSTSYGQVAKRLLQVEDHFEDDEHLLVHLGARHLVPHHPKHHTGKHKHTSATSRKG